jgi:2Fe-2S ferredoxin
MITIHLVAADGGETTLTARPGETLMHVAVGENIPGIAADCGGMLTCATCHVYVREPFAGQLPPPAEDELTMLEFTAAPRRPGSRLSCQVVLDEALAGLTVDLPPNQH